MVTTPGLPNSFQFNDNVVINEIMYHAAPEPGTLDTPPEFSRSVIPPIDADTWRYNNTGADLGSQWAEQTYAVDGVSWLQGRALLGSDRPARMFR